MFVTVSVSHVDLDVLVSATTTSSTTASTTVSTGIVATSDVNYHWHNRDNVTMRRQGPQYRDNNNNKCTMQIGKEGRETGRGLRCDTS